VPAITVTVYETGGVVPHSSVDLMGSGREVGIAE
jgi:hypothetical protein